MEIFRPNLSDVQPKRRVPQSAPIHITDPTHDTSDVVSGPPSRGESFDCNSKRAADGHPINAPKQIVKRLTERKDTIFEV